MNVLLISEHYYPKVGGTVSYVEHTVTNLAKKGINVYLLVPSIETVNKLTIFNDSEKNITYLHLGVSPNELTFNSKERDILCSWIKKNLIQLTKEYQINVVHLLFGLFLAEAIDTGKLHQKGIKTINTIHNVPPFECSNSWKGDSHYKYYKDLVRKVGVKWLNKKRIKKNPFNFYIVPSNIVKNILSQYVSEEKIKVIGHGGAELIPYNSNKKKIKDLATILTVGGIVPHKNQHLIPSIAAHLKEKGLLFKWNIVGPSRNSHYANNIKNDIVKLGLENIVFLNMKVNDNELKEHYNEADLYIQLSSEEGFCMTILDAIAYGIPTLGTPAGAIPEMLELTEGNIIENNIKSLKPIIAHYLTIIDHLKVDQNLLQIFKKTYTWENTTTQLINIYHE